MQPTGKHGRERHGKQHEPYTSVSGASSHFTSASGSSPKFIDHAGPPCPPAEALPAPSPPPPRSLWVVQGPRKRGLHPTVRHTCCRGRGREAGRDAQAVAIHSVLCGSEWSDASGGAARRRTRKGMTRWMMTWCGTSGILAPRARRRPCFVSISSDFLVRGCNHFTKSELRNGLTT